MDTLSDMYRKMNTLPHNLLSKMTQNKKANWWIKYEKPKDNNEWQAFMQFWCNRLN